MRLKDLVRSVRRRALAPFKRLEKRIKYSAQRFVVKAIQESGITNVQPAIEVQREVVMYPAPTAVPSPDGGGTKLLLAFLKASQRSVSSEGRGIEATAIGDGRLLVSHPTSGFMIADAANIKLLPQLILKSYQEQSTIAIEREFCAADNVIHLGAGQGYHTLTLASTIGEQGRVFVVESQPTELAVLGVNIEAHSLESRVSVRNIPADQRFPYEQFLSDAAISGIYVSSDCEIPEAWLSGLAEFFKKSTKAIFVVGARRLAFAEYVAQRSPSVHAERRVA